jgi:hypothetical protein
LREPTLQRGLSPSEQDQDAVARDRRVRMFGWARRLGTFALVLLLSASAVISYEYFWRVDVPRLDLRLDAHRQILAGTAPSPYRFRVLVPWMGEALTRLFSIALVERRAFLLAYAVYEITAVALLLCSLYAWLRRWYSEEIALVGGLFVAATIPLALQDHFFQPWSLLEVALFTLSLMAIERGAFACLSALTVLGSLNRETAVFVPVAYWLANNDLRCVLRGRSRCARAVWMRTVFLFLLWAIVFVGLRLWLGPAEHAVTIPGLFRENTSPVNLLVAACQGVLFLGGMWVFAVVGARRAPEVVQRMAWLIPLYAATILVWGVWREVRLLMPLYPLVVPMGLSLLAGRNPATYAADALAGGIAADPSNRVR